MSGKAVRDTLGFLGVVASLVFVGTEIRQNTSATRGATQQELQMTAITVNLASATDGELADLASRIQNTMPDPGDLYELPGLTPGETWRVRNYFLAVYRLYENAHYQYELGNLDPVVWDGWRSNIALVMNGAGRPLWPLVSARYSESFRTFVDSLIEAS